MTLGEYRVGITFNPSNNEMVEKIKRAAADLIDLIVLIDPQSLAGGETPGEVARLKAIAMTHFEEGAMSGVKAATKPPR